MGAQPMNLKKRIERKRPKMSELRKMSHLNLKKRIERFFNLLMISPNPIPESQKEN